MIQCVDLNCILRGSAGLDFNANLAISTIDFGTAHVSWWNEYYRSQNADRLYVDVSGMYTSALSRTTTTYTRFPLGIMGPP